MGGCLLSLTQGLWILDWFLFALLYELRWLLSLQICFEASGGSGLLPVSGPLSIVVHMIKEVLALRHLIIQQFWVFPAVFVFDVDVLASTLLRVPIPCLFQNPLHEGFL